MTRLIAAWPVLLAALLTVVAFAAVVLVTGFLACGISGCTGAGFGPAFAPVQAQLGLLAAGATWVPLAGYLLRRRRGQQALGMVGALVAGSVLAMVLLQLGPDGCPWGQSQERSGPGSSASGSLTCSADRDAVMVPSPRVSSPSVRPAR